MPRPSPLLRILPLLSVFGCASPGPPDPPSLHLPGPVQGLAAERVGDAVHLSWTSPLNTTDGDRLKAPMTAVLCRELPPRQECMPVQRLAVAPGPSTAIDPLPANLASGPPRLLLYRVDLENPKGRSAGPSGPVFAAAGAAPPAVGPLQLTARRNAVLVRWTSVPPTPAVMELKRTLVATADGPVKPAAPAPKRSSALGGSKPPADVAILHGPAHPAPGALDGLLDPTVQNADSYLYVAQRVIEVTLSGHTVELRGLPSPAASFAFRDILPPQPPTGLVAIPGEGFGAPLCIDLSWEPNAETDLLGYNVYRRTGAGEFRRINAEPVPTPAYRDLTIDAGQTYTYHITAVDQRRNESSAGAEVHETPRP